MQGTKLMIAEFVQIAPHTHAKGGQVEVVLSIRADLVVE
jgi:hypothetical protein